MWPKGDETFLDVVTSIKRALNEIGRKREHHKQGPVARPSAAGSSFPGSTRSGNLRTESRLVIHIRCFSFCFTDQFLAL
jgi:hypothetical protein